MISLATLSLLVGALLGLCFRVHVLVPAIMLALVVVAGAVYGGSRSTYLWLRCVSKWATSQEASSKSAEQSCEKANEPGSTILRPAMSL